MSNISRNRSKFSPKGFGDSMIHRSVSRRTTFATFTAGLLLVPVILNADLTPSASADSSMPSWTTDLAAAGHPVVDLAGDVAVTSLSCGGGSPTAAPVTGVYSSQGASRWTLTASDPLGTGCLGAPALDSIGNSYFAARDASSGGYVLQSRTAAGTVRWTTPVPAPLAVNDHAVVLGWDGNVYLSTSQHVNGQISAAVLSYDSTTGQDAGGNIPVANSDLIGFAAYPGGLVLMDRSAVRYYSYSGAETSRYPLPSNANLDGRDVSLGSNGAAFISYDIGNGCGRNPQPTDGFGVAKYVPTGQAFTWQDLGPWTCGSTELAATPDGGVVVSHPDNSDRLFYRSVSPAGATRWTHNITPAKGVVTAAYGFGSAAVDTLGTVAMSYVYSYPGDSGSQQYGVGVDFATAAADSSTEPSINVAPADGADSPYLAVDSQRLYISYLGTSSSAAHLTGQPVTSLGPSYTASITVPNVKAPLLTDAEIAAPSPTDRLLTRGLTIHPSSGGPTPAVSFEYGWRSPGSSPPGPTSSLQTCSNITGQCFVNYSPTQPAQTGWNLLVRGVAADGSPGPWLSATQNGVSSIATPAVPVLIALGDSVTSGHHRLSDQVPATCNDASYGYPAYVWRAMRASLPQQWRAADYANLARSGFSTSSVVVGGTDACSQAFGSPLQSALVLLRSHSGSWNRVVMTAGIDDTNWGDLLVNVAKNSWFGARATYTASQCKADLKPWDAWGPQSVKVTNIQQNLAYIDKRLAETDSSIKVVLVGYYSIAPAAAGHPPIPVACRGEINRAVTTLNGEIRAALSGRVYTWVDSTKAMQQTDQKIQSWLPTDGPGTALKFTVSGWPHPNTAGAEAIASAIQDTSTGAAARRWCGLLCRAHALVI